MKTRTAEEKEAKANLSDEEKKEIKENKKKLNTPFVAFKPVKETTKNPEKLNEKFDLFVANLQESYTSQFEALPEDNLLKRIMADFVDERKEEIDEYKEKHNKDPAYDPEDEEKNRMSGAEISDFPFDFVDV